LRLNRKHISGFVRLLTILGLIGIPSSGWGQSSDNYVLEPSASGDETSVTEAFTFSLIQMKDPNLSLSNIERWGDWAYAVVEPEHTNHDFTIEDHHHAIVLLGYFDGNDGWNVLDPLLTEPHVYNSRLNAFPNELLDENTKLFLNQPEFKDVLHNFNAHKFPWEKDKTGYVTRKDGDKHTNQIDFDILGRGTSGDVYASKPGTVVFVKENSDSGGCDFDTWKKANMVVIEHSSNEYSWYVHLTHNSVDVSVGQRVDYGSKIGREGNTGYSCGTHLHYMVSSGHGSWTDPNNANDAPWGSGIIAVDFDEGKWSDITAGPYTSKNSNNSTPSPNRPPNTPSLRDPNDGSVSRDGRAPTLCWNNNGDPDGDQIQFYAEVFDSERSANSGWISSTCWRPGNLDGNYFNYQWRVKARDNRNVESSWSGSRRFTIEPENRPPTISFNTANGNPSGEINSRDQSWTFTGTAGDPEGRLNRVEFKCEGDSCNATQNIGTNGSWSFQRDGLTGRNRIWFTACDDRQCVDSRAVTLRIDLAPPVTTADANGQSNPSGWFRGPVEVKLRSQDGATGSASVGVREIRYRIDNGNWQNSSGDSKSLTINTDGAHTVEYYAVDHLDNQESPAKRIAFQIDASPPSAPGAASETHGVGNDQWQKSVGAPEFTWGAASDSTSGLQHYELYFGPDANSDQIQTFVAANADRRWAPLPNGVRTGVYYLRARARDLAGNYSAWSTLFTFRYDITPPGNPTAATHAANLPSGSWQRTSATADFIWTPPSDEGSGVKGYYIYWGDQPEGKDESTGAFRTSAAYGAAGPLCAASQSCTGYLRVRSVDYVDNFAGDWSTLFALRYDGAAPTLDFTINGGVTQTAQTLVSLNLNATDQGSGVRDARSFAGDNWSAWEPYQTERIETIPAIGRQSWPVYVQVRDAVGWESAVISQSVYFEVNRPQPKSANFWLFTGMVNGGNGSHVSANYQGRSSVGQSVDTAPIASPNYILRGGYQVASQALPLQVPEHDEFTFINGVFASGIVNDTMQSAQYRLASSIGQMGLPANQTTLSSAGYQLQPGFLAAVPARQSSPTPPPTPTPGPTPTPVPPQGCEFATLSINQGALFTNTPKVTLDLCGPNAAEMKVSNDGSFANAPWEPYRTSKGWTLTTLGQNVIARLVQARFKDRDGLTHHYAVDDIIYDPTAPSGAVAVNDPVPAALLGQLLAAEITQAAAGQATAAMESFTVGDMTYLRRLGKRAFDTPVPLLSTVKAEGVAVYLIAQDDNSGLAQMQLSENANGDGAAWQAYDGLVQWMPSGGDGEKQLYARFGDSAGNASGVYSATVVIDSQPPLGGINILEEIIGANTVNLQLYLAAEDNLSSIPAIRLSHDPAFADAPWQPFAAEMKWPIQVSANENEKTIYVQFRDAAGNISQTYSDTVLIDRQPPVMYVEVAARDSLARQVNLYAYDELSALTSMRLSNDPMLIDAVVTLSYSDTVAWTFDERRVVWVQVDDSAGNRSDPYPAYAALPGDIPNPPVEQRVYLPLINR
jgi:murein DD-endopeptidase MepM/ murein hydrolase activator NlpD